MITNFADMIVEYDDVIPADKCQEIIEKFEYDHRKSAGITASDTEGQSDGTSIKKSTDLWISQWPEWAKYDQYFFKSLSPYVKKYLTHIKEKLGDAYGGPLMEELIIRMERTVAHFDFEVETMLKKVTKSTNERKSTLDNIRGEEINESVSDYEKKLESPLEDKGDNKSEKKDSESDTSNEKESKKGLLFFFKRKKK